MMRPEIWFELMRRYFPIFIAGNFLSMIAIGVSLATVIVVHMAGVTPSSPVLKYYFAAALTLSVILVAAGALTWKGFDKGVHLQRFLCFGCIAVAVSTVFVDASHWIFISLGIALPVLALLVLSSKRYRELVSVMRFIRLNRGFPPEMEDRILGERGPSPSI